MKIVAPAVADKDWYSKVESHAGISTVALALQYGTTAGDIILLRRIGNSKDVDGFPMHAALCALSCIAKSKPATRPSHSPICAGAN